MLAAAVREFSRCGYAGTSTEAIAQRAGISQPYLFRLFGTKKDLFLATLQVVDDRIVQAMVDACGDLEGGAALMAMGMAYLDLMRDPDLLQVQLHGFAAAPGDEDVAAVCRRTFELLWTLIHERTGVSDEEIRSFFASGMMANVAAAIDLLSVSEHWAQTLCGDPAKAEGVQAMARAVADRRDQTEPTEEVPA